MKKMYVYAWVAKPALYINLLALQLLWEMWARCMCMESMCHVGLPCRIEMVTRRKNEWIIAVPHELLSAEFNTHFNVCVRNNLCRLSAHRERETESYISTSEWSTWISESKWVCITAVCVRGSFTYCARTHIRARLLAKPAEWMNACNHPYVAFGSGYSA